MDYPGACAHVPYIKLVFYDNESNFNLNYIIKYFICIHLISYFFNYLHNIFILKKIKNQKMTKKGRMRGAMLGRGGPVSLTLPDEPCHAWDTRDPFSPHVPTAATAPVSYTHLTLPTKRIV